jgi:hypothetical protein
VCVFETENMKKTLRNFSARKSFNQIAGPGMPGTFWEIVGYILMENYAALKIKAKGEKYAFRINNGIVAGFVAGLSSEL